MLYELIENKQYKKAYQKLMEHHPHDQAILLMGYSDEVRTILLNYFTDTELSEILSYLDPEDGALIISELELNRQKDVIQEMDIDDAVDVIDELNKESQEAILNVLEEQYTFEKLLNYEEYQAGSIMTPNYVSVEAGVDVKVAMRELINQAPTVESVSTIFIVDRRKYLGTVNLNKLIKTKSPALIDDLITEAPHIYDTDDISMSIHQMREYGLYEVAVLNSYDVLIGIITLDDAIERYEDEFTKDFANLSALTEYQDEENIFKASIHRLPWLLILLLASIPIAMSSAMFEEVIVAVSILALFQPLILDASGDVATQTLAVTLRKINQTDGASLKDGFTEVITGTINGVILGFAAGIITFVMAHMLNMNHFAFELSIVVGLSLLLTVIIGPILGFLVPVILNKIKLDPAVASGPFITTLVDILSLLIYFGLATLLLGGMI